MSTSSFSNNQFDFSSTELLPFSGSTCDCYRVKLYGKLHFIKRLKEHLRTDPRHVAALQKEFETGYVLEHPNLVRYLSMGSDYLLTEYVDGDTLSSFVKTHPKHFNDKKNADHIVSQLLDVVAYLHAHQIVHLDLKPDNIMVTRIGHNVKLIDLGYCYTDTYTDTMGRTDKYAAPEQLDDFAYPVDARTDIYAIGKVLQRLPCAKRYSKAIKRCTQPNPRMRYQSVAELQAELLPRRRWMTLAAIAATAMALAALVYFLPYSRQHDSANTATASDSTMQAASNDSTAPTGIAQKDDNTAMQQPQQEATAKVANEPAIAAPSTIVQQPAVSPQPAANTNSAPQAKRHVEIGELRKELKTTYESLLNSTMGHLRGKPYDFDSYNKAYYQYVKTSADNGHKLWENKYQYTDISMRTFYSEATDISNGLCNELYRELENNNNTQEAEE